MCNYHEKSLNEKKILYQDFIFYCASLHHFSFNMRVYITLLENSLTVSYENGFFSNNQFHRGFLSGHDSHHFWTKKNNFLRKIARQFLMHLEHEYSVS